MNRDFPKWQQTGILSQALILFHRIIFFELSIKQSTGSIDPVTLLTLPKSGHVKSVMIDEVFSDQERLAESLLRNWCWQWFYENRRSVKEKDYDDIRTLDNDVPAALKEQYFQRLQEL